MRTEGNRLIIEPARSLLCLLALRHSSLLDVTPADGQEC